MKRTLAVYSLIALLAVPAVCLAGEGVTLSVAEDGSTIAHDPSGAVLWRRYNARSGNVSATPHRNAMSGITMPAWDALVEPDPSIATDGEIAGPIFDSSGNAWIVVTDSVNLIAIQSNGTSGTWMASHIIGPDTAGLASVGLAVDQAGGFYVTYGTSTIINGPDPLMWTKYTPAAGWQAAALIYTSPTYFDETFPSMDSTGRLVVVYNANGISSIASNPTQSSWGAVQIISPEIEEPVQPSVAANKRGTRLALVYLLNERGLRYAFFNSAIGRWSISTFVPGSLQAVFSIYSTFNAFPIAVDESGNVTVACGIIAPGAIPPLRYTYVIAGFRYEGGQWRTQQLTTRTASLPSIDIFSSVAINGNGVVLIATPLSDGHSGVNVNVFRYTPGRGWDTELAAHYDAGTVTRLKVAWFASTEAVVVFNEYVNAQPGFLTAALYAEGSWGPGPAIPGNFGLVFLPGMAGAPSGEVLLGVPGNPLYVTFLRP